MYKYHCLNPISAVGLDQLDENYVNVETARGQACSEEAFFSLMRSG